MSMQRVITTVSARVSQAQNLLKTNTPVNLLICVRKIMGTARMIATAHRVRPTAHVLRDWSLRRTGKLAEM